MTRPSPNGSNVEIERKSNRVHVVIHTARPGRRLSGGLIGRGIDVHQDFVEIDGSDNLDPAVYLAVGKYHGIRSLFLTDLLDRFAYALAKIAFDSHGFVPICLLDSPAAVFLKSARKAERVMTS